MDGKSIDQIVCLGDTIQGGAQPKETVSRLRELKIPIVLGNADAWLLDEKGETAEPTTEEQSEVRGWTLSKLSEDDLAFIRTYQPTVDIELEDGQRLLCFHGSPNSYDDVLSPDTPQEIWDKILGAYAPSIMAGGHTHTQQVRRIGEGMYVNPGSVGLAYNVFLPADRVRLEPYAEYAVLSYDHGFAGLEFRRAHYSVKELVQIIRSSGRPHADELISEYRKH